MDVDWVLIYVKGVVFGFEGGWIFFKDVVKKKLYEDVFVLGFFIDLLVVKEVGVDEIVE